MLEAKSIHKQYTNGKKTLSVLRGVDLHVARGAFAAIVGPSGAGKSTLLHIMGGLDAPTQGKVMLDGENIYKLPAAALDTIRNKKIGFVFQFFHLLSEFTVLENVLLPVSIERRMSTPWKSVREKATGLLRQMGLGERLGHFPSQLSGGEKQRVAIARALMNDPTVLFCDEPTGNLDSHTGGEVGHLLKEVNAQRKMTVLLVTHNDDLVRLADSVYHLKDGVLSG
jgi:lipoprotein-releasing system ATP-binding protein